jgi:hypothetical protein
MKTPITLSLDDVLIQELVRRAAAEDRSRSHIANSLLRAGLAVMDAMANGSLSNGVSIPTDAG